MSTNNSMKRLYKSRTDRMIDGVCGGVAEYLGLDATLVRIAWVLLTLLGGSGIILYILAMIIMPTNPSAVAQTGGAPKRSSSGANQKFWGILFVVVGAIWFLSNMGLMFWHHWWGFDWDFIIPVLLILAGVAFLFGGRNYISSPSQEQTAAAEGQETQQTAAGTPPAPRKLYRSRQERKLFGVCGGMGEYFGIDPTIVRLLFIVVALASFGIAILAYILMAIIVPEEPAVTASPR